MNMYPDEETITIDGESISYPGLKNGKFTRGNPEDPDDKPSFIATETINLLVDNISTLISLFGGEPNNTDIDQLKVIKNKFNLLASLASPIFTGIPKVPTPANGDVSTQIANTEFVAKLLPAGVMVPFAGEIIPDGFLYCDGSAISRTAYANLWTVLKGNSPVTFTCTTTTKTIITVAAGHGFLGGERLRLFTTGTLTGSTLTQDYFVEVIDSTTFYLLTAEGGSSYLGITAQSGIHTFVKSIWGLGDGVTTFNLPDTRQSALVGAGAGTSHNMASVDSYIQGQFKDDRFQGFRLDVSSGELYLRNLSGVAGGTGVYAYDGSGTKVYVSVFSASSYGTPRYGTTTRGKRIGTNYIIKY